MLTNEETYAQMKAELDGYLRQNGTSFDEIFASCEDPIIDYTGE